MISEFRSLKSKYVFFKNKIKTKIKKLEKEVKILLELKESTKEAIIRLGKDQLAKEEGKPKKIGDNLNRNDKKNNGKQKYQKLYEQAKSNPRYIEEIKAHHRQRELWKGAAKLYLQRL